MKKILCLTLVLLAILVGVRSFAAAGSHVLFAGGDETSTDDGGGEDTDFA